MAVLIFEDTPYEKVREGLKRKKVHLDNVMMVMNEFNNGPWEKPEPIHSHPHEQTTYIAKGEVIFYCEDEEVNHLKSGDMFYVPSGKNHTIRLLSKKATLVESFSPIREDFLK
jgi:quercetin dioxygenase-like cupin family protein